MSFSTVSSKMGSAANRLNKTYQKYKKGHIIYVFMLCYIVTAYNGRACHLVFLACCFWLHFNTKGEIHINPTRENFDLNRNLM